MCTKAHSYLVRDEGMMALLHNHSYFFRLQVVLSELKARSVIWGGIYFLLTKLLLSHFTTWWMPPSRILQTLLNLQVIVICLVPNLHRGDGGIGVACHHCSGGGLWLSSNSIWYVTFNNVMCCHIPQVPNHWDKIQPNVVCMRSNIIYVELIWRLFENKQQ